MVCSTANTKVPVSRRTGSSVAAARGCWLREAALGGVGATPHGDPLGRDCDDVGGGVEAGAVTVCWPAARPQTDLAPGGLAPIIVVEVPGEVDASTGPAGSSHMSASDTQGGWIAY